MQVNISTRHGHLSEASQAKITAKVEKLSRFFERLTSIEVTVDLEHSETPQVDLRVSAEHKHDFVSTARSSTLANSLDQAVSKLEQQLKKYKEKIQERSRTPGDRGQVEAEVDDTEDEEYED